MNRGVLIGILFLYLALLTLIADSLSVEVVNVVDGVTNTSTPDSSWVDLIGTFWSLLSFQLQIPFIPNLLFVYPPLIALIWNLISFVRGV